MTFRETLSDLFEGSQLITSLTFDPAWDAGCPIARSGRQFDRGHHSYEPTRATISLNVVIFRKSTPTETHGRSLGGSVFASEFNWDFVSFTQDERNEKKLSNRCRTPSRQSAKASASYKNSAGKVFRTYPRVRGVLTS
jgi:predicted dithiol-disulfide oxidoreductase (DUF899 family)